MALWLTRVNDVRLDEGLNPYKLSSLLTAAAQRHADDLAANGFASPDDPHLGSDGTHEQQRIAEAGYKAWSYDDGDLIVDENVWAGSGTIEDALSFFLADTAHRDNVLSDVYREIGVGFATDADGRSYHVLDFGARPNVLPIFINDGAASADNPEIAIRLTNERARPQGEGASLMGEAIEIQISNEPTFEGLPWQAWSPLVPWTLADAPGERTVYVQFRDAAGRTAASTDSIVLDKGTPPTPTPVPPTATPEPTSTPIPPSPTPAPSPTTAPTPAPSPTPSSPPPTPAASPTTLSPSPAPPTVTPFPTWTPLPSPQPVCPEDNDSAEGSAALSSEIGDLGTPLVIVAGLQGVAVVLGLYLALRRGGST